MTVLLIGIAVLSSVLGLFYLKDWLESPALARFAYSELVMRFAVIGAALIIVGAFIAIDKVVSVVF